MTVVVFFRFNIKPGGNLIFIFLCGTCEISANRYSLEANEAGSTTGACAVGPGSAKGTIPKYDDS